MKTKTLRLCIISLLLFLAVTAIVGGFGLLTATNMPPVDELKSSPFKDYTLPGLALLILVGGTASAASIQSIRRGRASRVITALAGVMIVGFESVEVMIIGSPVGTARSLQFFYFSLGAVLILLTAMDIKGKALR